LLGIITGVATLLPVLEDAVNVRKGMTVWRFGQAHHMTGGY
jgi:hypothetical protein